MTDPTTLDAPPLDLVMDALKQITHISLRTLQSDHREKDTGRSCERIAMENGSGEAGTHMKTMIRHYAFARPCPCKGRGRPRTKAAQGAW